ncbi:MAG: hypothetical protein ACXW3K_07290 [Brevundimonas sp.]
MTDMSMQPDDLQGATKEELQATADFLTHLSENSESVSGKHPMTSCRSGRAVSVRVSRRLVVEEMWNEEFEDLFFSWQRLTNPQHRRLAIIVIRSLAASA